MTGLPAVIGTVPAPLDLEGSQLLPPGGSVLVALDLHRIRVVLSGEVDIACAPQTDAACVLARRTGVPVVVDASRVTFLDAAAVGALVRLRRAATGWRLQDPSAPVLRMLELTDLTDLTDVLAGPAPAPAPAP